MVAPQTPELRTDALLRTKPFNHQLQALAVIQSFGHYWALLMEMGTGKTLTLVHWALENKHLQKIDGLILLCPKPLMENEEAEFHRHSASPEFFSIYKVSGSAANKIKIIQQFDYAQQVREPQRLPVLICNYESTINDEIYAALHAVIGEKTAVVCDESTKIKSHSAKRAKKIVSLGERAGYRGIMTGSPVTESPMDAFMQFRFLSPSIFGGSYFAFRATYGIMGGYGGHQVVGYKNMEQFKKKMLSCSFRVEKKDCLDLPDKVHEKIKFTMPEEMEKVYTQMADQLVAEFEGETFQAAIALTKIMRLKEITSGYIKDGLIIKHLKQNPKVGLLKEIIEDTQDHKIIVWCREREEIRLLKAALADMSEIIHTYELHGDVRDKQGLLEEFKKDPTRSILLCQVHTGGMGFNITEATLCVYFSNDFSREIRAQSEDRCHRAGQKNHVTYVDLVAKGTVDEYTLKVLAGKERMASSLTDIKKALYFGKGEKDRFEETEF